MLDLQFLCDNLDAVRTNCANRGVKVDLDGLLPLRDRRNALIVEADKTRQEQKTLAAQIPKADAASKPALVERGRDRARRFRWETTARETLDAYEELDARAPRS